MVTCKNCHDTHTVKNGFGRAKQRYQCKLCGYNFVLGDERHSQATEVKKALCVILSSRGNASFGFLATPLGVSRTTTDYWIRQAAASTDEPMITEGIRELESVPYVICPNWAICSLSLRSYMFFVGMKKEAMLLPGMIPHPAGFHFR